MQTALTTASQIPARARDADAAAGILNRRWFAIAVILLAAVPLLWPELPPLTDLPGHVGRYRVMTADGTGPLSRFFTFEWRWVGNLGMDAMVAALASLLGLEPAVKATVILIQCGSVAAILALSRQVHGRVTPFVLFAVPLVYNQPFHFGFLNYCMAMGLALAGLSLWLRLGRQKRYRLRAALAVPFSFLVWTAHIVGWGSLCLLAFGAAVAERADRREGMAERLIRAALSCFALAGPIVLMLLNAGSGGGTIERFFNLVIKARGLASIMRDQWIWVDLPSTLLVVLIVYAAVRGRLGRLHPVAAWMSGVMAAAVLAMPFMVMGSAYADVRLLPYAMIVALVGIAPAPTDSDNRMRAYLLVGMAFCLIRLAATTVSLIVVDQGWQRETGAIEALPRGARVMAMVARDCDEPWGVSRLIHLPGLAMARRDAFVNSQWPMLGAPLMRFRNPRPGYFDADPSQIVLRVRCPDLPANMTQSQSLATFPRERFTHLWLIRPHPVDPEQLRGMTLIWSNGDSKLFRIDR
ncbi:hypothetical protein ACNI3Q_13200 [Sphingomonas sp. FW199]|uniref:hypothetical protein n=1 Tax=Sphingomonas sp. FW199 TaxID=3400217 RepID=UPI003CEE1038